MKRVVVRGGVLVTPEEERLSDIWTEGQYISGIGTAAGLPADVRVVDGTNCYVTPGLFDLQVNGGPSCDFWQKLDTSSVLAFSADLLSHGMTSILATFITGDLNLIKQNRDFLQSEFGLGLTASEKHAQPVVRIPGIHLEGPCLSPAKPGVHPPEYLRPLAVDVLKTIVDSSVKLITVAPELDQSGKAIEYLQSASAVVSLGHSNATYDEARQAFARGVNVMTHTFNALPAIHHRNPGAVTAALLDRHVSCCMICDGLHLAPAAAELIYRMKGKESTILVTDIAHIGTADGGLVGSSIYLDEAVRNVVQWGICGFREAIVMATYNPARLLGMQNQIGSLSPGAYADLLLWDKKTLALKQVIFNGELLELAV